MGFLLVALIGLIGSRVAATNKTVVSIHVDSTTKTISTEPTTVGNVLERADIKLGADDLVEPGAETNVNSPVFNINVYRAKPYVVVDGGKEISVNSPYTSPKLIAEKSAGLKTYPEDTFTVELIRDFVKSKGLGYRIVIDRAFPVTIEVDGTTLKLRTQQETIEELLKEKGIVLDENDKLSVDKNQPLKPNMKITVIRVGHEVLAQEEIIPYQTLVTYDESKEAGFEEVTREGKNGSQLVTYKVKKHNGVVVQKTVLQTVVATEPVAKKVIRGTEVTEATWAALRQCESGGFYANKNNPTYRGAYQFDQSTWNSYAPAAYVGVDPADAPPHVQDQAARSLQSTRGWSPWPSCASKLGLL